MQRSVAISGGLDFDKLVSAVLPINSPTDSPMSQTSTVAPLASDAREQTLRMIRSVSRRRSEFGVSELPVPLEGGAAHSSQHDSSIV